MPPLSAEHRLGVFYAALFATIGASAPFLALWLDARGVAPAMIGTITAAPSIAMVLTTVAIGRLVDRLDDRRSGLLLLSIGVLVANSALAFAGSTLAILALWTLGGVLMHAVAPITDAHALGVTARRGSDWARVRLAGSIGFLLALLGAGALYERVGIGAFLSVLIGGSVLRLLAAWTLPGGANETTGAVASVSRATAAAGVTAEPAPTATVATGATAAVRGSDASAGGDAAGGRRDSLYRPGVLLTIGGGALINASHGFFYAFGLLVWTRAGIGETSGSLLWAAGVVAEIALMWRFRSIAARLSARGCLVLAGLAAVLRWTLTGTEPPVAVLLPVQCLHALTFGLAFLATASFIARRVDAADAARGQALAATLTTASLATATWLSGLLYERAGTAAYGAMALLALAGIALVAASYRTGLD